jgi:hypothetical protein
MATTKKTSPSKKLSTKSIKNAKNAPRPWSWRFSLLTLGIYTIVVATLIVAAYTAAGFISKHQNDDRLDRINGIYTSLNLDGSYVLQDSNIFGDKRVYSYDKSRTTSSSVKYVRADTVSNTVADVDAKIKAAGYTFVDEPYAGSVYVQYHYKSAKGEYIRLTVSSKPYDDAVFNTFQMKKEFDSSLDSLDKNAGPSTVLVKVNLDDNNE